MKVKTNYLFVACVFLSITSSYTMQSFNSTPSDSPELTLTYINRAAVMIEANQTRLYIDPYQLPPTFVHPADLIFITHDHEDHLSITDISAIYTENTTIVCSSTVEGYLSGYNTLTIEPFGNGTCDGVPFSAIPMYNFVPSHSHAQASRWIGYVLQMGGFTIAHLGDSDYIPEYQNLTNLIDILLFPIYDSYYMMGVPEAHQAIETIKPRYAIPVHYLVSSFQQFKAAYPKNIGNTELIYLYPEQQCTFPRPITSDSSSTQLVQTTGFEILELGSVLIITLYLKKRHSRNIAA